MIMHPVAVVFFTLSVALLFHAYCGYLGILYLVTLVCPKRRRSDEGYLPRVTLLISAHNEEAVIREKLENSLVLEYPDELLEVIVCSDASTDRTDRIVEDYAACGIKLLRQDEHLGKTECLNKGVAVCGGDVVVFSDANSMYDRKAIRNLVRNLADSKVGYVVGHQRYRQLTGSSINTETTYWDYEIVVKKLESKAGSVVGGDGAIYAIRKHLYEPMKPSDINDFLNPLKIILKGYAGVFEPEAVCYENAHSCVDMEFRRKTRIISRSLRCVLNNAQILNPLRVGFFAFEILSHKILRWFAPFFLIVVFSANAALITYPVFRILFVGQLMFYLLACIRLWFRNMSAPLFSMPYYFCMVNVSAFLGVVKALTGNVSPTWSTRR